MTRRISYCLFSGAQMPAGSDDIVLGGLFNWPVAFDTHGKKGDMSSNLTRELLEEFDIVHVNFTPGNASYIAAIRDSIGVNSDTKIIANVDFAIGLWNSIDPLIMRQQLNLADFVFHVEPVGATRLTNFLGRDIPAIPHPVDVDKIFPFRKQPSFPIIVACSYHRYMYTWATYFYSVYHLKEKYGIRTALMNYSATTAVVALDSLFDDVVDRSPYAVYLDMLGDCFVHVDLAPDYTYGRGIVEAAALGVPTIGSNTIDAMNVIWPDLAVPPHDDGSVGRLLEKLLTDNDFATDMAEQGTVGCKRYNLKNSYDRMIVELEKLD